MFSSRSLQLLCPNIFIKFHRILKDMKLSWLVLCLVQWWRYSSAYHILALFPVPSRSHNTLGKGIVDALLEAGHEVTWATPYPPKNAVTRLNIIDVSSTIPIVDDVDFADPKNSGLRFLRGFSRNISHTTLVTPALRSAIINSSFDAVITEPFFSKADGGIFSSPRKIVGTCDGKGFSGFLLAIKYAAVLQIPWIAFQSVSIQPYLEQQVDEVRSITTVPMLFNFANIPMGFLGRLLNSIIFTVMTIDSWIDYPTLQTFYKTHFGSLAAARGVTLPPLSAAYYNVSLLFVNSHPSLSPAKSLPPNVVEIGGFHINENTPLLPKDLQELLDGSPQGVVYFSMGSVLKSANLPAVTKQELLKVFSELPYTVLWKFEEQLEGKPKNVHIRSWMPQDSILAHPNVKLCITHGGLLSMMEAVYYGVPLIMIPVYGDQGSNAIRAEHLGIARTVAYSETMAGNLKAKMEDMMQNDSYSKRVKYLSKLFRNRPVKLSKLIAHSVEVVIESQGAYHLRSSSLLYAWYERWMLDQLALLLGLTILVYTIGKRILRPYSSSQSSFADKVDKIKKS